MRRRLVSDPDSLLEGILHRERRMSTNVGHGVAIPHFITDQVDEVVIAIGRSSRGIDFSPLPIRRPVHVVILILSAPGKRKAYLRSLACIARLFRNRKVMHDFLRVKSAEEAVSLLRKYEALSELHRQLHIKPLI